VRDFFQKENTTNAHFVHKLSNAPKLSEFITLFAELVGVRWMNENVFRIDKKIFARLVGVKAIEGSLFHQQGNFPTHNFIEMQPRQAREIFTERKLVAVDFDTVKLMYHESGVFVRSAAPEKIEECKWVSCRQKQIQKQWQWLRASLGPKQ
jgi:hypothetical protein